MAKNMARINNGIVVNIVWCSDTTPETVVLKDMDDRPVAIGDTYSDGNFYRDGEKILTELEYTQEVLADAENAQREYEQKLKELQENSIPVAELEAAYQKGVDSAYD